MEMELENTDIKDARASAEPLPPKGTVRSKLDLPADYDELRLFALLKWRFGGPNGIMTRWKSRGRS